MTTGNSSGVAVDPGITEIWYFPPPRAVSEAVFPTPVAVTDCGTTVEPAAIVNVTLFAIGVSPTFQFKLVPLNEAT